MLPPRSLPNTGPNNLANEEERMRQALGLRNGPSGPTVPQRREAEQRGRRFVKDGEVPVVVVHSSREAGNDGAAPINRIAAAEAAARTERNAREQAERALAEAQSTIQHLRTQLAHADIAHREALAAERSAREQAEVSLREANEARAAAEARSATQLFIRRPRRPPEEHAIDGVEAGAAPQRRRGRRPKSAGPETPETEQEPVKWWLPTYRAGRKR